MRKLVSFAIIVLLTCSCSVYKKYERPSSISADNAFGDDVQSKDTVTIADIKWNEFFRDPCLQALISEALKNNIDVNTAAQRVKQSEASLKVAKLSFLPSFSFEPSFGTETSKKYDPTKFTYDVPIKASWEIDVAGKLLGKKRKAKAAYEQSLVYQRYIQTQVVSSVANCYYTLLMLDAQMEISQKTAESWKANVRTMKAMKKAGMTNEASIARSEASSCSIDASLFDLEYDIRNVQNSLALLLGTTPKEFARGKIEDQVFDEHLAIGIPAQMLSRRPDVMFAEKNLEQAFYATSIARSSMYPSLTLTGSGGWENTISNPSTWFLSFAAKLVAPIFNAGQRRAQLRIAQSQQEEALLAFRQALLKAGGEVNNALAKCKASRGKTDLRQRQIDALESAVNSTQQLMRLSESTYLEVLTAQQSLLSAQLLQISDRFQALQGVVNLYKALGGGADPVAETGK